LKNPSKSLNSLCNFVAPFGSKDKAKAAEIGIFALSYSLRDYEIADTAFLSFESTVFSNIIVGWLKGLTKRERPNTIDDPFDFHFDDAYSQKMSSSAFPSGDVMTAFSFASVIAARSESLTIAVVSYSLAGLVAFERVYLNVHWLSDVLVSAAIATVIGKAIVKFNSAPQEQSNIAFIPIITEEGGIGGGIVLRF
ncbi:MAG: phosphatase PAP2 family protein, partial [Planctomycetota bacterium]